MRTQPSTSGGLAERLAIAALAALLAAAPLAAASPEPAFKILVEHAGVYRVTFEDLAAAGLAGPLPSAGLGLETAGRPVPAWVEDGGDGVFGPGDWLELVGERLRGDCSWASEHTRYNVTFLRFDHASPSRMRPGAAAAGETAAVTAPAYRRRQHLEEDLLILRLPPARTGEPEELWYWAKLAHNLKEPFAVTLDLHDLSPEETGAVEIGIQLRGWSRPRSKPTPETADHRVEVRLDGELVAGAEWNGTEPYRLEIPALPAARLRPGDNTLTLTVSRRPGDEKGRPLIDVVMLNWIEVDYPRDRLVGDEQTHFTLAEPTPAPLALDSDPGQELLVYGDLGSRSVAAAADSPGGDRRQRLFLPAPGERSFFAASPARLWSPDAVVRDRPSRLADADNRADYIVISHPSLIAAIEPLAELHRSRGLEVLVADVDDVYDEFSHGVVHPRAIRDFLAHAYHRWRRPAPRFVLLVGDASWDGKNENTADPNYADWTYRPGETLSFGKNQSTPYAEAGVNRRGLVPTWNHTTDEGHSASDNYFVSVAGDDHLPEMAIGRLPVVEPEEVARIVAKTVRYVTAPEVGPWRRNALFITNDSRGFQRQSDHLALGLAAAGFAADKVYPEPSETSNERHTRRLIETFDQGQLLVHFLGHGGRYIWRTGPPDLKKNHDLFTLDHLEQLAPTGRLPVVLSLTCYSAPFDHPSADSIGEKLLRLGDRGAIAVFAASWRNSPSPRWGEALLEELTAPGATVGEAVRRAKHRIGNPMFVETYNLLGDPAVPVALPAGRIKLSVAAGGTAGEGKTTLTVRGTVAVPGFAGRVLVDLVGGGGETLGTVELEAGAPEFGTEIDVGGEELTAARVVRAYGWDAVLGVDAAGALELPREAGQREAAEPVRGRLLEDRRQRARSEAAVQRPE